MATINTSDLDFEHILKLNGIYPEEVSETVVKASGLHGENFASITEYATVKFKNPEKSPLHLFTKRKSGNDSFNKMLNECQMFEKEAEFFMSYVPFAKEYCKSVGCEDLLEIYPKCYFANGKMAVLENLLERGFTLLNKDEPQDFECAKLALINIAKHHAISYAIIQESGGPDKFRKRFPTMLFEALHQTTARNFFEPTLDRILATNAKIIKTSSISSSESSQEAIAFLESQFGKIYDDYMLKSIEPEGTFSDFLVLNHGDAWNNNMMFAKDPVSNKPEKQIMIDFQLVRLASPCVDLGYFLFTSVDPQVRQERLSDLLKIYLATLEATLKQLNHPLPPGVTFETLWEEFRKRFTFGYWIGLWMTTGKEGAMAIICKPAITQVKDMFELFTRFDDELNVWLDEHPEACENMANRLLSVLDEYKKILEGTML